MLASMLCCCLCAPSTDITSTWDLSKGHTSGLSIVQVPDQLVSITASDVDRVDLHKETLDKSKFAGCCMPLRAVCAAPGEGGISLRAPPFPCGYPL
jgi:hypothetical protein